MRTHYHSGADAQTVVLCSGQGMTLLEIAQQMGPAGVTAALEETLDAPVDNYIYCTPHRLASLTENFGSAQLKLTNYMTSEALGELQLSVPGVSGLTLSTGAVETLEAQALSRDAQTLLRAQGYLAFARAACGQLEQKGHKRPARRCGEGFHRYHRGAAVRLSAHIQILDKLCRGARPHIPRPLERRSVWS